jgi:signal peptidase I
MKNRSAILSAIFSIIMPGLGHIYNGKRNSGILIALAFLIFYLFILSTGVFITFTGMIVTLTIYFAAFISVIIHSIILARKNSDYQLTNYNKPVIYILMVVLFHSLSYLIGFLSIVEANRLGSDSMNPTLQEGDFIICLVDKPALSADNRGQLITFTSPYDNETQWIKRAIAFEGETIEIISDSIFIDGVYYTDPHPQFIEFYNFQTINNLSPTVIPEGKVFVLGDNRNNSEDSRHFGSIDVDKVTGRPLYIYWSSDKNRIGNTLE